ncbi:hypothetical protein L1987_59522 [Smallanthus sonchifolius]|uniref:Uncharacterized protein n=1 Tax=Smallanthus sonchifolius TaxID=185202 RepID=A0ACB9D5I4_9ASTR|nr:hypothetical protein L1987_59522 [Smallanthus sonchifolius]
MNPSHISTSSKRKRDPSSFDDEPSSCKRPKNDVFMNYSSEDIGKSFISHLQGALKLNSFTISDHSMLPVGQDMHLELLKAIEESEIYVLVFSPNYASSKRDEAKFVLEIVEELEKMQRPQALHVTDHPVGIGSRAEELISTLGLDRKDHVLVVAVFGISGIGKTTIFKEVFNRIASSFDVCCFLADIHYICQVPNWKVELPKALISCLTHENKFSSMSNHNDGVTKIRRLVSRQKVLLVLDDIDNFQQLESLGICPKWFYEGSRIIVTTRETVPGDDPVNTKFIYEVVSRAGGLPLVLKVWSRHFQQYEREQWPSILETLKGIPHGDVQKQLQMSYDSLTNRPKKLFLDIACFFEGMMKDFVIKVLQDEDSRFLANNEIQYLVDKSLVEITSDGRLRMHDAIREMGQEIVPKKMKMSLDNVLDCGIQGM